MVLLVRVKCVGGMSCVGEKWAVEGQGDGMSVVDARGVLRWRNRDVGDVMVARKVLSATYVLGWVQCVVSGLCCLCCLSRRFVRWGVLGSVSVAQAQPGLLSCWRWDAGSIHLDDASL